MDEIVSNPMHPVVLEIEYNRSLLRPLILVVDDDEGNIRVLLEALQEDYEVAIATDGPTALELLETQARPDLILLDIMMPGMDGYELCRRIKQIADVRTVPVIFITALADEISEAQGFAIGAVDYIHKPFKISLVRARVRTHMTIQGMMDKLIEVNARLSEAISELDRRQFQMQEAKAREELFARVFASSAEGIIVTDPDGTILAVNAAFMRISGYSNEEAVGQNTRLFKSGHHSASFYKEMWESLRTRYHWRGEVLNRRKNGEIYPELRTMSAIQDDAGTVTHYVAVFSDISGIQKTQERIDFLTWHDPLTRLPNRLLYLDHLDMALRGCGRNTNYSAAIVLDIDGFRALNDAQGLVVGDTLLQGVGERIGAVLSEDDTLARLGADEFAIVFSPRDTRKQDAAQRALATAEEVRNALAKPFDCAGRTLSLSCSIGIAVFPRAEDERPVEVLQNAETARNRAMRAGGNQIVFFEGSMGEQARQRFVLEHDLQTAIIQDYLQIYLQTQVGATGKIVGAEALVRWQHPERGLIPPGNFIPLAEETRLIIDIDRWMLLNVARLIKSIQERGKRLRISVNISPRHFAEEDFEHEIVKVIRTTGIDPALLMLEVTEGLMILDVETVIAKMKSLGRLGVRFSIDDFGSGYSSLAYLKRLPIQELKIDQTFVLEAPTDANDALIIEMIYGIAGLLGIDVVAEGVETETHVAFLSKYKKLVQQGYHYGKPKPAAMWLENNFGRL